MQALNANRKRIAVALEGFGVTLGCLLDKGVGGFGRFWMSPRRVWRVLEGLEGLEGFGGCLEGLEGFGGFGGFWSVWSVCGLANGSFESP